MWKTIIIDPTGELKKIWDMKMTMILFVICVLGTIHAGLVKALEDGLRNQMTSKDHPDYSITKIDKITEKSPGKLRKFAVSQTPMNQITLVWKTFKGVK